MPPQCKGVDIDDEKCQHGLKRLPSVDFLNPPFSSPQRKTSFNVATFNLVATIVGGGVLSLPMAFAKAGLILATIMMVFSALITEFGLYLLCACARRTGSGSYMDIVRNAFGPPAEIMMTTILWFFLSGVLVAFDVLLMGIFAPIVRDVLSSGYVKLSIPTDGDNFASTVLFIILVVVSPLMLKRDLYALRHICYVGFSSVCVIVITMGVRSFQRNFQEDNENGIALRPEVKYFTTDLGDAVFAFPIIVLAFLCAYNVVEVQCAIKEPTRSRVKSVLRTAISSSFFLFEAFGLVGYFYAYNQCKGNIFLNFDASDPLIIVGRLGMGLTLMFATPVVTLPCREAFLSIAPQILKWWKRDDMNKLPSVAQESQGLMKDQHADVDKSYASINHDLGQDYQHYLSIKNEDNVIEESNVTENIIHVVATFAITASTFLAAVAAPGVAVVWSILGSSLGMIIGFIVPSACYLKIRAHKGLMRQSNLAALCLLVFSTVVAVVCTAHTISDVTRVPGNP